MAVITLNIPDAQLARIVDAICKNFSYSSITDDGQANPETKNQYAKRMIGIQVKDWVKRVEGDAASSIAKAAAISDVDTIPIT